MKSASRSDQRRPRSPHRRFVPSLISLLLLSWPLLYAQIEIFDYPLDARYFAMGFTGSEANKTYGHFSNPAFGFDRSAIHASFTARPVDWVSLSGFEDFRGSFAVSFPFQSNVGVEIFYDYFIIHYTSYLPDAFATTINERLFGVSLKRELIEGHLVAGVSLKQYLLSATVEQSATVLDLGLAFRQSVVSSETISSVITSGVSLHNFGTNVREEGVNAYQPPRYVRVAIGWSNSFGTVHDWTRASLELTFAYANSLNRRLDPDDHYRGLGIEVGYLDALYLRTGLLYNPYTSFFGTKNEGTPTYGAGLAIPLHRFLALSRPVTLVFDYARMGLQRDIGEGFFINDFNHEAYALRLSYGLTQ